MIEDVILYPLHVPYSQGTLFGPRWLKVWDKCRNVQQQQKICLPDQFSHGFFVGRYFYAKRLG